MRILVLTSRYTATRDIISEDFGRQTRLFSALAEYGHDITFFCADYRKKENKKLILHGMKIIIRPFTFFRAAAFACQLRKEAREGGYDALIATSDPLWGVMGLWASRKAGIKFVYDLHDNYEVYRTYELPFIPFLERNAARKADIVTTVSYSLKKKVIDEGIRKHGIFVVQNGADTGIFRPMGRIKCRKALNLPKDSAIIMYAGSLQRSQGIDVLIDAFKRARQKRKNALLAIAGNFFGNEEKYLDLKQEGIEYLGSLSQAKVAMLINSADVCVVPNRENAFTKYCFPYKAAEYAACGRPMVVTNVGDAASILGRNKQGLCMPDNPRDMSEKILRQLRKKGKSIQYDISRNTWHYVAGQLDKALKSI